MLLSATYTGHVLKFVTTSLSFVMYSLTFICFSLGLFSLQVSCSYSHFAKNYLFSFEQKIYWELCCPAYFWSDDDKSPDPTSCLPWRVTSYYSHYSGSVFMNTPAVYKQ